MTQNEINYSILQGNVTMHELARRSKELIKKNGVESPDIRQRFAVKVDSQTTIYTKSEERYKQLLKQYSKQAITH